MSNPLCSLLGETLLKGDAEVKTAEALAGKTAIGLYFSAHWCPPCKMFTPELARAYTADLQAKGLEVVFVSSDKSDGEFKSYYAEQPWLALPYAARDLKAKLSKQFKVSGIPSFVILDGATGELITLDGRAAVSDDWKGERLPWRPPSFWEVLGSEFLQGTDGETVEVEELKGAGKVIGLYFSAHWCPPCRGFTPDLIKSYSDHLKAKGLEIVFVSSDRDAASFQDYYGTMPWLAIPNGDKRKDKLSQRFGVQGIPSFVLVDGATGETINGNARGKISADPTGEEFPWWPKALVNLNDEPEGINETTALIVLSEGCDDTATAAHAALLAPLAEASKQAKEELLWFHAPADGQIAQKVRQLTGLAAAGSSPQMVLLDIPDDGGFYVSPATEVSKDSIEAFLVAFKSKALERKQLGG